VLLLKKRRREKPNNNNNRRLRKNYNNALRVACEVSLSFSFSRRGKNSLVVVVVMSKAFNNGESNHFFVFFLCACLGCENI